ncbi:MAG: hypothetical protein IJT27_02005 [Clostridia bacterium]|nr:hypothetical protein [Clostridia bacterium]
MEETTGNVIVIAEETTAPVDRTLNLPAGIQVLISWIALLFSTLLGFLQKKKNAEAEETTTQA